MPFESLLFPYAKDWTDASAYVLSKYKISYLYYCGQLLDDAGKDDFSDFLGVGLEYDQFTLESMKDFKKDSIPIWAHGEIQV